MCVYKRTLFAVCNHSQWSSRPHRLCSQQQSYLDGRAAGGPCTQVQGHPLATHKVQERCGQCAGRQQSVSDKLSRAKAIISQSKLKLAGADRRCRAMLEDSGIEISESEDETEAGKRKKGDVVVVDADEVQAAADFLKRRQEGDAAKLYM